MKALIIHPAFLGDAIISLALAEELRRLSPESHISYLVRPEVYPVIKLSPSVDKVFAYDKYKTESGISGIQKKANELNAEKFDAVFTLHTSKRTRLLLEKLDIPIKVGYGEYSELTHHVEEVSEPQTSRAIRLLQPIFSDLDLTNLPKLQSSGSALLKEILALPRPIIAIAPDSVWKTKEWGIEKFRKLIFKLSSAKYSIVVIGSDCKYSPIINDKFLNNNILDLIAKTSLQELVSVIEHCDLLISNDSAPVHIATATRTSSLAILGPTVSEFGFAPPKDLGQVIEVENLWCRPCTSHGSNECPIHTHECMLRISIEEVYERAVKMLDIFANGA
jgi:heptosyltransferase-2